MSDLIDRQAAIDALEKIPVREFKKTDGLLDALVSIGQVYRALKQLPSAQQEIIRCKDCKNYQTDWQPLSFDDGHYCAMVDTIMPYDGFCHMGERREDE